MVDFARRRSFTLALAVLLGGCSAFDSGLPTASGRVDHKYVTASTKPLDQPGSETETLVIVDSEGEIRTLDGAYDDRIDDSNSAVSVPDSLHAAFDDEYAIVRYHVQIELTSRDPVNDADSGGLGYRTTRAIFNDTSIDSSLTYEISEDGDRMTDLVDE